MLKVEKKVFEKVVDQIITSTDIRELIREFSLYRIFFYSLLSDIAQGRESRHYYIVKRIARDRKISEQFIIEQARSLLSHFGPEKPKENYYEVLNVSPTASAEDIRKSWINLMKTYHPDTMGEVGLDVTKKLNEAYELLKDPVKRREYNARLLPIAALPIVVVSPWTFVRVNRARNSASTNFLLPATLIIVISGLVFYLVGSGLLVGPFEKMRGFMGLIESKPEYKVESAKLLKPDPVPTVEKPLSSEPERKEEEVVSSSIEEENLIINDKEGIEKEEVIEEETIEEEVAEEVAKEEVVEKKEFRIEEAAKSLQQAESSGEELEGKKYLVKKGDTLLHVAKRYKTSVKDLKAANELKDDKLRYGEVLIIPPTKDEDLKPIPAQVIGQDAIQSGNKAGTGSAGKEREKEALVTRAAPVEIQQSQATQKEIVKAEVQTKRTPTGPDRTSLHYFILEYVSAYKSRDMNRFISLFEPGARENGVEISQALSSYRDNFSSLRIVEYDVRVKGIDFNDHWAFVDGDFVVTFRGKNENTQQNSRGNITWLLSWLDNTWKIKEINYRIKDTK